MQDHSTSYHNPKFGYFPIAGAVTMFAGAALWGASGTDIWAALEQDTMAEYLVAAGQVKSLVAANLSAWCLGVILLGIGGVAITERCTQNRTIARAALLCIQTGVALGIAAFLLMLSIVLHVSPDTSEAAVMIAETIGWAGAFIDNVATVLIVGAGPFLLALAGKDEWMPRWLVIWAYLAGLVGLLAVAGFYLPLLAGIVFLIVPVGLGWMIAVGVVQLRMKPAA